MSKRSAKPSWSVCKEAMASWPRAGVVALIQELYRLSDENRRFLHARLMPQQIDQTLADAQHVIRRLVSPSACFNNHFQHAEVKRVVDQFAKATDAPSAIAELLITDIERSMSTLKEVGSYDELVDHAFASMERLETCLDQLDPKALAPLVTSMERLSAQFSGEFGYGLSDELDGFAAHWRGKVPPASWPAT